MHDYIVWFSFSKTGFCNDDFFGLKLTLVEGFGAVGDPLVVGSVILFTFCQPWWLVVRFWPSFLKKNFCDLLSIFQKRFSVCLFYRFVVLILPCSA